MALIDVDIEDNLDQVRTRYLVRELIKRHDLNKELAEVQNEINNKALSRFCEISIPEFKNSNQLLRYVKRVLGLREWHDKKRVIQEIEQL